MEAVRLNVRTLRTCERGATAIEYGLIVALIGVTVMGAMGGLGGGVGGMWTDLSAKIIAAQA